MDNQDSISSESTMITQEQKKAIKAWMSWYSKRLNDGDDYTGYEQDLFEAFYCIGIPPAKR